MIKLEKIENWLFILFNLLLFSSISYCLTLYLKLNYNISFIISIIGYFFLTYKHFKIIKLKQTLCFLFSFIICGFLMLNIWDLSYDGFSYHQNILIQGLENNKIPFCSFNHFINGVEKFEGSNFWGSHYTVGAESCQLFFAKFFGNIEAGKLFQLILLVFTILHGFETLNYFKTNLNKKNKILITVSVVLSPVILTQMFTFLVDIILHLTICNLFFIVLILIKDKKLNKNQFIYLIFFVNAAIFSKPSGFVFICFISFYFFVSLILDKSLFLFIQINKKNIFLISIITCCLNIFPFITNLVNHNNALYPVSNLEGANKGLGGDHGPLNFDKLNKLQQCIYGYFSQTSNANKFENNLWENNSEIKIKIPFSSNKNEWLSFYRYDVKKGGFGPFFSGFLIISFLLLIYIFLFNKCTKKLKIHFLVFYITLIIIPFLLFPAAYFARYQATIWLIIPFSLFILINYIKIKTINFIFIILLFTQTIIIVFVNYGRTILNNIVFQEAINIVNKNEINCYTSLTPEYELSIKNKINKDSYRKFINTKDTNLYNLLPLNSNIFYIAILKNDTITKIPFSKLGFKIFNLKNDIKK